MREWSMYERAAAYLSIECGLALGFIIPFVVSTNPGDFVALMFFPMIILSAYGTFFKPGAKTGGLAMILFFAGFPTFISVLFGSMRGVILSWLPVVLMVFLRLFHKSLIDKLEPSIDRITKGAIILLVSVFLLGIGMLFGAEPEGRFYIHESWKEEYSIFLTSTQIFLLTVAVSSSFFILDLIFKREILDLVNRWSEGR